MSRIFLMPQDQIQIIAPAKLNLCLDILKKCENGYHKIQTIYHATTQLSNKVKVFEIKESGNTSRAQHPLANQAVQLVKRKFKIGKQVAIEIETGIPHSSGLGGASSNAAAVLKALNSLWELRLSQDELLSLASELGMDVPFFIIGGTALGSNYGEILQPLPDLPPTISFRLQPRSSTTKNKTAQAYASLDLSKCGQNKEKTALFIEALHSQDGEKLLANLHNDFEQLYELPKNHHLSGSGPSSFIPEATT